MAVRRRFMIDLYYEDMGERMRCAAIMCGIVAMQGAAWHF